MVLVGEMRDLETIAIALTVAETGHLVFGTLHTNDAAQTIHRIVDIFPAEQQQQIRVQLALALAAVVHQELLPGSRRRPAWPPSRSCSATLRCATSSATTRSASCAT